MLLRNVFFAQVAGGVSCYGRRFVVGNGRQRFCHGKGVFCDGNNGTWHLLCGLWVGVCGGPAASAAVFSVTVGVFCNGHRCFLHELKGLNCW